MWFCTGTSADLSVDFPFDAHPRVRVPFIELSAHARTPCAFACCALLCGSIAVLLYVFHVRVSPWAFPLRSVFLALCVGQDDKNVNWSQERYDEITKNMAGYLKKIGFNPEKGVVEEHTHKHTHKTHTRHT